MVEHQGKKLREYVLLNEVNVDQDILAKLKGEISKATFYKLYDQEQIKPDYTAALLRIGIDFLGQSSATRLKAGLNFPQKEHGLSERVKELESQVRRLQDSLLDLYSRLPKQGV